MSSDDTKWRSLLVWLESFGMNVDADHLLVQTRYFPGLATSMGCFMSLSFDL